MTTLTKTSNLAISAKFDKQFVILFQKVEMWTMHNTDTDFNGGHNLPSWANDKMQKYLSIVTVSMLP